MFLNKLYSLIKKSQINKDLLNKIDLIDKSSFFDKQYYINNYEDVRKSKVDSIKHYILFGHDEGRNPSNSFNTKFYLNKYNDVTTNALIHYITVGVSEGRVTNNISKRATANKNIKDIYPYYDLLKNTEHIENNPCGNSVLIIAVTSIAQCNKYRVVQMHNIFQKSGYSAFISSWNDFMKTMNLLQNVKFVVFYRVTMCSEVQAYIQECDRLNIKMFYDIDDPVFDEKTVLSNSNIDFLSSNIQTNLVNDSYSYAEVMSLLNYFIVSTPEMKLLIAKKFKINEKNIIVRRNAIDKETVNLSQLILSRKEQEANKITIIYGTPSLAHSGDFTVCSSALKRVLLKYNGMVELMLVGDIELPDDLIGLSESIRIKPSGSYSYFLNLLRNADINIVPLLDNDFNKTKSNIKFIDASSVKTVSICSDIGDYQVLENNHDTILVKNERDWFDAFSKLIENSKLRTEIAFNAYNKVIDQYSMEKTAVEFIKKFEALK